MRSEFSISCGRGQCVLVSSPLLDVRITKCGRSEWVRSQERLVLGGVRIAMGCVNLVTAISRSTRSNH